MELNFCKEYFVTFIDDKSRFIWIFLLKQKSEVFVKFLRWKTMVEKSTGKEVKNVRSDNGGEYISHELDRYLKNEGIFHQYTIRKVETKRSILKEQFKYGGNGA